MAFPAQRNAGILFNQVDSTQVHPLGATARGNDGAEYRYIKAAAAISANNALKISTTAGLDNLLPTAAATDPVVAVAPVAIASGSWGWVITRGPATVLAAAGSAGQQFGASATAGTVTALAPGATYAQADSQALAAAAGGVGIVATAAASGGSMAVFLS